MTATLEQTFTAAQRELSKNDPLPKEADILVYCHVIPDSSLRLDDVIGDFKLTEQESSPLYSESDYSYTLLMGNYSLTDRSSMTALPAEAQN